MPLPLIIGVGAGVVTAGVGIYKIFSGKSKLDEAKLIVENAKEHHRRKIAELEGAKEITNGIAYQYGRLILNIRSSPYEKVITFLEKIKQRNKKKYISLLDKLEITPIDIQSFKAQHIQAKDIVSGGLQAVSGGLATSQLAIGAVGLLGSASTGTAISSLTGAAASNATLAWLGGGTLATGGGGMAMGTLVLGGLATGPAILIGGLILSSKAEKALTESYQYDSEVQENMKQIDLAVDMLIQINNRIIELRNVITKLSQHLNDVLDKLDINNFDENNSHDMLHLDQAVKLLQAISQISTTPIIDNDGRLTEISKMIILKYKNIK